VDAVLEIIDLVLRIAFFAGAPLLLVPIASIFDVAAPIANAGLLLAIFSIRHIVKPWVQHHPTLGKLLGRHMRFEAYYRERPPRGFVYYLFYPLLFPYWLINREARREFVLYRGFTGAGIVFLVGTGIFNFFHLWRPELGLKPFLVVFGITFVLQTLVLLAFLLPTATTVVGLSLKGQRVRLAVLLAIGAVSTGLTISTYAHRSRRHMIVSYSTAVRIRLRTAASRKRAGAALLAAVRAADSAGLDVKGGQVGGDALERAHDALTQFYKEDEAHAFNIAALPATAPQYFVIYFLKKGAKPVWRAIDRDGKVVKTPDLPANLRARLLKQAQD
jgi:hypothetical protein